MIIYCTDAISGVYATKLKVAVRYSPPGRILLERSVERDSGAR